MLKTDLSHLPEGKQRTLAEIRRLLLNEVEAYHARKSQTFYITWLILFGSYARGTQVVNPINGYISDFDILVAVNRRELVEDLTFWHQLEEKIDRLTRTPVNLLIHTQDEIHDWLAQGHYFFTDIRKDGIYLHTHAHNKGLPNPKYLTEAEQLPIAEKHFQLWFESASDFLDGSSFYRSNRKLNPSAFSLHQATERLFSCVLLVLTNYRPPTHNVKMLRHLVIDQTLPNSPFADIFPSNNRFERRCFARLKRAYIDSRYSEHFEITEEELDWLANEVEKLKTVVKETCETHITQLKVKAGSD